MTAAPSALPTAELLNTKIKDIETQTTLTEEQKNRLLESYRAVLADVEAIANFTQQAAAYRAALETAPAATQTVQAE